MMVLYKAINIILLAAFMAFKAACEPSEFKALMEKARQEQIDFCKDIPYRPELEARITPSYFVYEGRQTPIYVYKENDVVSEFIMKDHTWEKFNVDIMYSFLGNYMKKHGITDPKRIAILDIGANLGIYSLLFGANGYKVYAFEPGRDNLYALRKSMCESPNINSVVFGCGLSNATSHCNAYVGEDNVGNSRVICGEVPKELNLRRIQTFDLYKLDDFSDLLRDIVAIKIDVEGFEPLVVEGGMKIFIERKVPFIHLEFDFRVMKEKGIDPMKFLKIFIEAGYHIILAESPWHFLSKEEALDPSAYPEQKDIVLVLPFDADCMNGFFLRRWIWVIIPMCLAAFIYGIMKIRASIKNYTKKRDTDV